GTASSLELNHDVLTAFQCPRCGRSDSVFRPRGTVPERLSRCPGCQQERRTESTQTISGSELFLGRTLASGGVPPFDIVAARNGLRRLGFLLAGAAPTVLGPLHGSNPTTEGAS